MYYVFVYIYVGMCALYTVSFIFQNLASEISCLISIDPDSDLLLNGILITIMVI